MPPPRAALTEARGGSLPARRHGADLSALPAPMDADASQTCPIDDRALFTRFSRDSAAYVSHLGRAHRVASALH